jgi:hypothetical protein
MNMSHATSFLTDSGNAKPGFIMSSFHKYTKCTTKVCPISLQALGQTYNLYNIETKTEMKLNLSEDGT